MALDNSASELNADINTHVDQVYGDVVKLYRHLHRYPELSFQEHRTSARLADELEALGYEVTRGVGVTGVVALLRNGNGPTVMLRADMDALPIGEQTGLDYASQETADNAHDERVPVMHACGHDLHSSCLIGAAAVLKGMKSAWQGTLMLVFQPAEEVLGGAQAMLDDGLYERFGRPNIVLGQHNTPMPAGTVGHLAGSALSAATTLGVTIHGDGGHGSMPSQAIDPVVIAAYVVTRLQTIVSREVPPDQTAVVTVGKLQAGTQGNIIPHTAELEINVRSFDNSLHGRIIDAIKRIVRAECEAGRSPKAPEFRVLTETISLNNDPESVERVRNAHAGIFGADRVCDMPRLNASEDFPYFGSSAAAGFEGDDIPYVYWFVGATPAARWDETPGNTVAEKMSHLETPHSPYYFPGHEATLKAGMIALAAGALAYLR